MGIGLKEKPDNKMDVESREFRLTDYDTYNMSLKERALYISLAATVIFFIGFLFYRSVILSAMLCPLAFIYPRFKARDIILKRKNELNVQFKDMLYSLSSSVSAGKSVESAFSDVIKDLNIIYPAGDAHIIKEVQYIIRRLQMNETVEEALADFAERSHLEDIQNFADVFQTCKRTGGNIVEVIRNTTNVINDKIEIKQEIDTLLAEKRLEQKALNVIPVIMVGLLSFSASDYMAPIFETLQGRIAMTVALGLLFAAYFISRKVMDIKV